MTNEDELIDEALQGNHEAFGQLVVAYQDRLFNAMVHVVGSVEEAEDVVQDAFIRAYEKLEGFGRNSAFYTWLYRIAFNRAVSRSRRKRPKVSMDQHREATGEEAVDSAEAPDARLVREERVRQVHDALSKLNEEHRSVIVLREMEGLDYDTIGEILEIPVGTVRSRLHRARDQMRDHLARVRSREE